MKIKDSFLFGVVASIAIFFALYSIINIFTNYAYLSQSRDALWVYIVSLIPNLLLSRFMLVKWELESLGKGMMFTTLIGILLIMYIVLK